RVDRTDVSTPLRSQLLYDPLPIVAQSMVRLMPWKAVNSDRTASLKYSRAARRSLNPLRRINSFVLSHRATMSSLLYSRTGVLIQLSIVMVASLRTGVVPSSQDRKSVG